ncbi:hypothetical protein GQ457_11G019910 [Hibiscus cannabinus]
MASTSTCFSMEEGQSISKPPFFNGANYPYWKNRMMLFIQSTDYLIWDVGEHCYKAKTSSANSWYLDSGCSRHMIGDKSRFLEFKSKSGGVVTFGDNSKGNIEGIGSIGNHSSILIDDVLYVNGLKHNLLSISQLCDKGFNVFFESNGCKIINIETNQVVLVGHRIGNIYMVHLDDIYVSNACFVASNEHDAWLWHRKLGHASMSVLEKLISKNLVRVESCN